MNNTNQASIMKRFFIAPVITITVFLAVLGSMQAATVTWDGSGGDMSWTEPDSTGWSGSNYQTGDTAQFLGSGGGTVTIDAGGVNPGAIMVNSTVAYTFSGPIGGGGLTKTGSGILTLSGSTANTYTGLTTVSAGRLALGKTAGVNAVGGDLTISGGAVTFSANEQIADTATVTMSGATSTLNGTAFNVGYIAVNETIGSLVVTGGSFNSGTDATGWTVTGAASFTGGTGGGTRFLGHSSSTFMAGSLSLANMTGTAGGVPDTPNSFTLYGNGTKQTSVIVGGGGLTLDNSVFNLRAGSQGSRLVLEGNVTTTGTSTSSISEDTAGGTAGNIAVQLSSTAAAVTRTFNIGEGGANLTIGVPVTNGASTSAGITKTGAGTLTLSGANTFSGGTKVDAGTLQLDNSLALQKSTFDTQTGSVGTLSFGALTSATFGGLQGANDLALLNDSSAAVALTVGGNNASTTFSGSLSGTGGSLTKTGTGTLTLSGATANTYTGLTTVSAGTLQLSKTSGVVAVAGDVQVNGGRLQWSGAHQVADTASITLNSGILLTNTDTVANVTINNTNAGGQTYIHGLTINDTLTLAGGLPYLGSTSSTSANKVVMTTGGAIEMAAHAGDTTMNIGSGGLTMTDAVWHLGLLGAYTEPMASPHAARINLGGDFTGSGTNSIQYYNTNGSRLLDLQGGTRTFNITGGTTTIDATIQNGGLTKTGAGTLTLGDPNTFSGGTTINAGTLRLGDSLALQNSTFDSQSGAVGTLSFGALTSATFGGLQGANDLALVNDSSAAVALTVGGNDASTTFSGSLSGTGGSLTKTGTGMLTLSGATANTYTGLTTVSGGVLVLGKTSGVIAVPGDLAISNGAKVIFSANGVNEQIADGAAVTMTGANSGFNCTGFDSSYRNITETIGSLAVSGGVFHTGTAPWTVTGAASFTGGTGNTIFLGNSGSTSRFGSLSLTGMNADSSGNVSNSFNIYGNSGSQSSVFVRSGGLTLDGSVIYLRNGTSLSAKGSRLVLDGDVTTTGTALSRISEDTASGQYGTIAVELSSTAAAVTRTFNIGAGGADLTINVPVTNGASISAGITKTGAGTLTLSGANTYTGGTTISAGVVQLGADDVLADTGAVTVSGGTLAIGSRSDTVGALTLTSGSVTGTTGVLTASSYDVRSGTISAKLAGPGGLSKTTSGTVTLSGSTDNTYTGTTTVSGGTLVLGKASGVIAVPGDLTISNGAKVIFSANGVNEQIANGAAVTMSGVNSGFNCTAFNTNFWHITETIGSLDVSGGVFHTGTAPWTVTGAASFTGGGNTIFLGNSGSTSHFGSLSLTDMNAASSGNVANSFNLYGNESTQSSVFVGSGGLTLENSVIYLRNGSSTGAQGSRLVLDGDVTTTGTALSRISEDTASGQYGTIAVELSSSAAAVTRTFNIGAGGADLTISVPVTNGASTSAGLTKTGAGTLTLSGASTYTGPTTVEAGTLLVNGSVASDVTVNGGWLKGDGAVGGVTIDPLGSISAGNSPGLLSVDGDYEQSGLMLAELAGTTKELTYDSIDVSGAATFGPGAVIDVDLIGFDPLFGDTFDILTADQGITNSDLGSLVFDYSDAATTYFLRASIVSLGGSAEALRLTAVPEPSAFILLALGAGLLAWPGRHRKRAV